MNKKAHYLINSLKGFENINRDKVQYIEQDGNNLIITMLINPTDDYLHERIETIITYNLKTDAYKIVCKGKGSKKYNSKAKWTAETILKGRIAEAQKMEQADIADALHMTIEYYYNQLKEMITDKKELTQYANELHYKAIHECETVQEIEAVYNDIVNRIKADQQATIETATQETNVQETAQQTNETYYIVANRSFNTYEEALQYCNDCDFDANTMIEKVENVSPSHNEEKEVFYLYNNTFNTYNEAFNYACDNDIPVHMIISNKHPFMTNERLQELEKLYTFARHSMTYEQAKQYYDYLQTIPKTLDQQERLYKLKSILQRLENRQKRLQEKEQEQKRMLREIDRMINDLYALGMTKKEYPTHITYYLNGKEIYTWFSGITTERMYNELLQVYNQYVKYNNANAV
jgi:DNA segregation ATPase FtsK/SpoIIIE-like protein